MKFPYDLRQFAQRFEKMKAPPPDGMISSNALQIAKQKQIESPELLERLKNIDDPARLRSLADELMIAQTIGEALHLAGTGGANLAGTPGTKGGTK